jgi:hypothetical protein
MHEFPYDIDIANIISGAGDENWHIPVKFPDSREFRHTPLLLVGQGPPGQQGKVGTAKQHMWNGQRNSA